MLPCELDLSDASRGHPGLPPCIPAQSGSSSSPDKCYECHTILLAGASDLSEGAGGEEVVHHADDGRPLAVGDPVKDLLDLVRMLDGDGDGVGALQGVDPEHVLEVGDHELLEQLHVGLHSVHAQVLHVGGKPLVEPQICPPAEQRKS